MLDLILIHDDLTKGKPDPKCCLKFMKYHGMVPGDCIIFGDLEVDVVEAKRSGATFFVVRGYN